MGKRIFKFSVEIYGDVNSGFVMPVYDEYGKLAGGATCLFGNVVQFFIGAEHAAFLKVSTEESVWVTPRPDKRGQVSHFILSETQLAPESSKVQMAVAEDITNDNVKEQFSGSEG